jgi:hypothetical protein
MIFDLLVFFAVFIGGSLLLAALASFPLIFVFVLVWAGLSYISLPLGFLFMFFGGIALCCWSPNQS